MKCCLRQLALPLWVCCPWIILAAPVANAQVFYVNGVVHDGQGKPVAHVWVSLEASGTRDITTDSGEFRMAVPSSLHPGSPVRFDVSGWIITFPPDGRTFLPEPSLYVELQAALPVPVILKSVKQGSLVPTSKTVLTVRAPAGYDVHEVVTDQEGVAKLDLAPGKHTLSATGAPATFSFVVTPTRRTFTIQVSESGEPVNLSETGTSPDSRQESIGVDKTLAFAFGLVFVIVLLVVAKLDRHPSAMAILIYRVVLSLAASGIGAVIPGMIDVNISPVIRAGGAIALFVLVY